jgi:hypothetical protein
MPNGATTIRREHVEAFVTDLLERKAPASSAGYALLDCGHLPLAGVALEAGLLG